MYHISYPVTKADYMQYQKQHHVYANTHMYNVHFSLFYVLQKMYS